MNWNYCRQLLHIFDIRVQNYYFILHSTNMVKSISLSVHTQKLSTINGRTKSDGKIRSADMIRLDLWNNSNILWGIWLPSMRDKQSKNSLNCYWSEIPLSLRMCVGMHSHMYMACIHIYYKKNIRAQLFNVLYIKYSIISVH